MDIDIGLSSQNTYTLINIIVIYRLSGIKIISFTWKNFENRQKWYNLVLSFKELNLGVEEACMSLCLVRTITTVYLL